jgi:hypothetical protein
MSCCQRYETMRQILGDLVREDVDDNVEKVPAALSKLTGPTYSLSDIIQSGKAKDGSAQNKQGEKCINLPLNRASLMYFGLFLSLL